VVMASPLSRGSYPPKHPPVVYQLADTRVLRRIQVEFQ
jgi:hypothetical protein